jgi:predicted O-methyltransferase YrrM
MESPSHPPTKPNHIQIEPWSSEHRSRPLDQNNGIGKVLFMRSTNPLGRFRKSLRRRARRIRLGKLVTYLELSERIPGWKRGAEAEEMALAARTIPGDALIVEIGVFLGSATMLLAGARKLADSGMVHCVDPFDGSGDEYSVPVYAEIAAGFTSSLRNQFMQSIRAADLNDFVTVHDGTAESIGEFWKQPIDLLFLDGDQSPEGARSAFSIWEPWLKPGGVIVMGNSSPRQYEPHHDGNFRITVERVIEPAYRNIRIIGTTTFAEKC